MKLWFFIVFVFIGLTLFGAFTLFQNKKTRDLWTPRVEPVLGDTTSIESGEKTIEYDSQKFDVVWVKIPKPENVLLIQNFSEKKAASDLFSKNSCSVLVNGGFYTKDFKPTGQFISDYQEIRPFTSNRLFDGVLSINQMDTPRIMRGAAQSAGSRIALQSGPIVQENDEVINLKIRNDYPARRVIAAITGANELYFLSFYKADQVFSGPKLEVLPQLLSSFETVSEINFADGINLDGGSASAFFTSTISLSELTSVGSFFCYKGL